MRHGNQRLLAQILAATADSLRVNGVTRCIIAWLIPGRDATGQVIVQAKPFDYGGIGFTRVAGRTCAGDWGLK